MGGVCVGGGCGVAEATKIMVLIPFRLAKSTYPSHGL